MPALGSPSGKEDGDRASNSLQGSDTTRTARSAIETTTAPRRRPRRPAGEKPPPDEPPPTRMPCCGPLLALAVLATAAVGLCTRNGQLAEALAPGGAPRGLLERAYVCSYVVDATVPHLADAFTQGLTIANGTLYESDGLYGYSQVRSVDRTSGWTIASTRMKHHHFAEGIEVVGNKLVQLMWKASVVLEYSLPDLRLLREVPVSIGREGWGLASDGRTLYVTDSGSALYHVNPDTYEVEKRLTACLGLGLGLAAAASRSRSARPPLALLPRVSPPRGADPRPAAPGRGERWNADNGARHLRRSSPPLAPHTPLLACVPAPLPSLRPPSGPPARPPPTHPQGSTSWSGSTGSCGATSTPCTREPPQSASCASTPPPAR